MLSQPGDHPAENSNYEIALTAGWRPRRPIRFVRHSFAHRNSSLSSGIPTMADELSASSVAESQSGFGRYRPDAVGTPTVPALWPTRPTATAVVLVRSRAPNSPTAKLHQLVTFHRLIEGRGEQRIPGMGGARPGHVETGFRHLRIGANSPIRSRHRRAPFRIQIEMAGTADELTSTFGR